jgi:Flp pilus assembly protein TadG
VAMRAGPSERPGATMTPRNRRARPAAHRAVDDAGTAILEFTLVAVLLLTIVFGIINFGLILSFKQDMTRAAAEGARAGAVAFPATAAWTDADTATDEAVTGFDRTCGSGDGLSCYVNLHDCTTPVAPNTPSNPASTGDCITVELVYDYDSHPLLAKLPMIEPFLPNEIRARSVARTNS